MMTSQVVIDSRNSFLEISGTRSQPSKFENTITPVRCSVLYQHRNVVHAYSPRVLIYGYLSCNSTIASSMPSLIYDSSVASSGGGKWISTGIPTPSYTTPSTAL